MDDLKITHRKSSVVDKIIGLLKDEFEEICTMSLTWGKVHDCLGMTLDFSKPDKFIISMEPYLKEILKDIKSLEIFQGKATTPATDHLFKMRDNAEKLNEEMAGIFH